MNHSHDSFHRIPLANKTDLLSTTAAPTAVNDHAHHMHHGHNTATSHDMHLMRMWFHGGAQESILFECWKIETYWGLFLSSIIILLMGVLYEGLKWIRVYLNNFKLAKQRQLCPKVALSDVQNDEALLSKSEGGADGGTLRSDEVYRSTVTRENNRIPQCCVEKFLNRLGVLNPSPFSPFRILQTVLYIVQITLAYWLMLIAMTYNTYLTAAVILGCGLGHWIFAISNFVRFSSDTSANEFATDVCH